MSTWEICFPGTLSIVIGMLPLGKLVFLWDVARHVDSATVRASVRAGAGSREKKKESSSPTTIVMVRVENYNSKIWWAVSSAEKRIPCVRNKDSEIKPR